MEQTVDLKTLLHFYSEQIVANMPCDAFVSFVVDMFEIEYPQLTKATNNQSSWFSFARKLVKRIKETSPLTTEVIAFLVKLVHMKMKDIVLLQNTNKSKCILYLPDVLKCIEIVYFVHYKICQVHKQYSKVLKFEYLDKLHQLLYSAKYILFRGMLPSKHFSDEEVVHIIFSAKDYSFAIPDKNVFYKDTIESTKDIDAVISFFKDDFKDSQKRLFDKLVGVQYMYLNKNDENLISKESFLEALPVEKSEIQDEQVEPLSFHNKPLSESLPEILHDIKYFFKSLSDLNGKQNIKVEKLPPYTLYSYMFSYLWFLKQSYPFIRFDIISFLFYGFKTNTDLKETIRNLFQIKNQPQFTSPKQINYLVATEVTIQLETIKQCIKLFSMYQSCNFSFKDMIVDSYVQCNCPYLPNQIFKSYASITKIKKKIHFQLERDIFRKMAKIFEMQKDIREKQNQLIEIQTKTQTKEDILEKVNNYYNDFVEELNNLIVDVKTEIPRRYLDSLISTNITVTATSVDVLEPNVADFKDIFEQLTSYVSTFNIISVTNIEDKIKNMSAEIKTLKDLTTDDIQFLKLIQRNFYQDMNRTFISAMNKFCAKFNFVVFFVNHIICLENNILSNNIEKFKDLLKSLKTKYEAVLNLIQVLKSNIQLAYNDCMKAVSNSVNVSFQSIDFSFREKENIIKGLINFIKTFYANYEDEEFLTDDDLNLNVMLNTLKTQMTDFVAYGETNGDILEKYFKTIKHMMCGIEIFHCLKKPYSGQGNLGVLQGELDAAVAVVAVVAVVGGDHVDEKKQIFAFQYKMLERLHKYLKELYENFKKIPRDKEFSKINSEIKNNIDSFLKEIEGNHETNETTIRIIDDNDFGNMYKNFYTLFTTCLKKYRLFLDSIFIIDDSEANFSESLYLVEKLPSYSKGYNNAIDLHQSQNMLKQFKNIFDLQKKQITEQVVKEFQTIEKTFLDSVKVFVCENIYKYVNNYEDNGDFKTKFLSDFKNSKFFIYNDENLEKFKIHILQLFKMYQKIDREQHDITDQRLLSEFETIQKLETFGNSVFFKMAFANDNKTWIDLYKYVQLNIVSKMISKLKEEIKSVNTNINEEIKMVEKDPFILKFFDETYKDVDAADVLQIFSNKLENVKNENQKSKFKKHIINIFTETENVLKKLNEFLNRDFSEEIINKNLTDLEKLQGPLEKELERIQTLWNRRLQ
jgi:hypothetical protein